MQQMPPTMAFQQQTRSHNMLCVQTHIHYSVCSVTQPTSAAVCFISLLNIRFSLCISLVRIETEIYFFITFWWLTSHGYSHFTQNWSSKVLGGTLPSQRQEDCTVQSEHSASDECHILSISETWLFYFTSVSMAWRYYMIWCNLSCVRSNQICWNVPSFSFRTMQYALTTWCTQLGKSWSLKLLAHLPCSSDLSSCDFISRVKESLCRCQFEYTDAINKDFTASLYYLSR
jgi:hypothetical protein